MTRREFGTVAVAGSLHLRAQNTRAQNTEPQFTLQKVYNPAVLLDVSPDGSKLAVWRLNEPREKFFQKTGRLLTWISGGRTDSLQVVERSTGTEVFSHTFDTYVSQGTFFSDGHRLFVAPLDLNNRSLTVRGVVLDIARKTAQVYPKEGIESYFAQAGSTLIRQGPPLTLVSLPDYREIQRIDIAAKPFTLSRDRSLLAYATDRGVLVCRRASDLDLVWEHPFDSTSRPRDLAISVNNRYVVAAMTAQSNTEARIYEAATVRETARLPVGGMDPRC